MRKRCSNCDHCGADMKAIFMGFYIDKCFKNGHCILHPFWSGWRCKGWRKRDGK